MNILYIVDDPTIFTESSEARIRLHVLAQAVGTLHVLSACGISYRGKSLIQEDQLFLHAFPVPRFMKMSALAQRARALVHEYAIEIVSAQDPFECGAAALRAVEGTSAKLHIQISEDFISPWFVRTKIFRSPQTRMISHNRLRQRLADRVLPKAQGICVVSKRIQDSLLARYGSTIVASSIIPPEISPTLPSKVDLPGHAFTFVLMTFGPLEPQKRIEDILVALARIKAHYPGLGLMIVGDGSERKRLEKWARVLGLSSRVLFLGDRPDALGLLQNASAFIQGSAYDGYGIFLIEAALARAPIITTDVGLVGELFRGYEDVLAAPPGDPTNLAVHITGIIEDVPVREQLVMRAEKTAREYLASVRSGPVAIAADLQATLLKGRNTGNSL